MKLRNFSFETKLSFLLIEIRTNGLRRKAKIKTKNIFREKQFDRSALMIITIPLKAASNGFSQIMFLPWSFIFKQAKPSERIRNAKNNVTKFKGFEKKKLPEFNKLTNMTAIKIGLYRFTSFFVTVDIEVR